MKNYSRLLAVLAVGVAGVSACAAGTLANPTYTLTEYGKPIVHRTGPVSSSGTCCNADTTFSDSATLQALSSPSVEAFAATTGVGTDAAGAYITYYFEINGPAGPVPLDISAHFLLDYQCLYDGCDFNPGNNEVRLSVSDGGGCCVTVDTANGAGALPGVFSLSGGSGFGETRAMFHTTAFANSIIRVDLEATAYSSWDGHGHALIDEFSMGFGSGFDSSSYSLAFSPGIGNSSADAPEPGTVGLMLSALGGLAACRRRFRGGTGPRS